MPRSRSAKPLRDRVSGLADRLPAPRDKAARALLSSAKDLAMGRDPAARQKPGTTAGGGSKTGANALLYPPGHYYSPIVDVSEVTGSGTDVEGGPFDLPGINLDLAAQTGVWAEWAPYVDRWTRGRAQGDRRYHADNSMFGTLSAQLLAGAVGGIRPKRYVEIGSGFTSAVLLDINEEWRSDDPVSLTLIEPYPQRLESILRDGDRDSCTIIREKVQSVDLGVFDKLESGDVLFIDSTHVAKSGSDVLTEIFEILPRMPVGVYIHLHDVGYPFDYPKKWLVEQNRSWNEAYFLRAFLMYNTDFEVYFWPDFVSRYADESVPSLDLLGEKQTSIWLRRVAG